MASVPLSNYGMMKVYTEQKKIRKFSNILDKSFSLYIEYILIKKFYMNNFEYRGVWNMYRHGHPKWELPRNELLMKNPQFLSDFAQTFRDW